jgi:hypothetical protein
MKAIMYLMIICLPFQYASAQTPRYNFDFEDWYTDSLGSERLEHWDHIGWNDNILYQLHGTKKSTNSYSGHYAITIHRWYVIDKDALRLKQPISGKPNSLNGFYTYTDAVLAVHPDSNAVNDIATVTAYFMKWNTLSNSRDTIGYGYQELSATAGYRPFSCAITYTTSDYPDSFYIYIRATKSLPGMGCKTDPDCSFLTVDNLSFSNAISIDAADAANNKISIYPNPARQELFIRVHPDVIVQKMYLADIMGRVVMIQEANIQKIKLNHLSPGNYFLKLQTNEGWVVKNIVVE